MIHGDDFSILGSEGNLDWFRGMITGRFEVTFRGRIGSDNKDSTKIKLLNRVIQWEDKGIVYEADQKHADMIIKLIGLTQKFKSLSFPSSKTDFDGTSELLVGPEAIRYGAITA